jgi:hypothetical protein
MMSCRVACKQHDGRCRGRQPSRVTSSVHGKVCVARRDRHCTAGTHHYIGMLVPPLQQQHVWGLYMKPHLNRQVLSLHVLVCLCPRLLSINLHPHSSSSSSGSPTGRVLVPTPTHASGSKSSLHSPCWDLRVLLQSCGTAWDSCCCCSCSGSLICLPLCVCHCVSCDAEAAIGCR